MNDRISTQKGRIIGLLLFLSALSALILYRVHILYQFHFQITDSDQTIMWLAAKEYAQGRFHELLFWGQDYNTMLESLLAVPFIWLNYSPRYILPVVTSILAIIPFFFLGLSTIRRVSVPAGISILVLPFLFSPNYDLITGLSRGFVTGIAIGSISLLWIFNEKKAPLFLTGFLACLAYLANPNSAILSSVILTYILVSKKDIKNP